MYTFGLANFDMTSSGTPGEGVSEQKVKDLINQAASNMQSYTDTAVTNASENYDDTKIYATYADMLAAEPTGREDVLYIITDEDNTRYIWNGSEYTAIEGRIGYNQIQGLFS